MSRRYARLIVRSRQFRSDYSRQQQWNMEAVIAWPMRLTETIDRRALLCGGAFTFSEAAGRFSRQHRRRQMDRSTRPYIFAWAAALLFYVLEYSTRSAPGVMIPQLEQAFSQNGVGL